MKTFQRPNPKPSDAPLWREAEGYHRVMLSHKGKPGETWISKYPKVRGKALVKAAKRRRMNPHTIRPEARHAA